MKIETLKVNTAIFIFLFALYKVKPRHINRPFDIAPHSFRVQRPLWRGIPCSHSTTICRFAANFHTVPQVAEKKE